jgi:hypothetical protein
MGLRVAQVILSTHRLCVGTVEQVAQDFLTERTMAVDMVA